MASDFLFVVKAALVFSFGIRLPRRGMTSASKVNLVKAGDEDDDSPFGALEKVLIGWLLTLESSRSL
jgi:hypothetical protein